MVGLQLGPRLTKDRERFPPNNVLLMLAGAGLLWLGWAGFNGGDPYAANIDSSIAVINTNICAAMSLLVWTLLDVIFFRKPSVIGAVQGMITGLVVITPAAGKEANSFNASQLPPHWCGIALLNCFSSFLTAESRSFPCGGHRPNAAAAVKALGAQEAHIAAASPLSLMIIMFPKLLLSS
jgi:hypothetical protein